MNKLIRRAETGDIPAIADLLLNDARIREGLNPCLWSVVPEAPKNILASLDTIANPMTGPVQHHWMVSQADGAILSVTHSVNMPAPPIYDLQGGNAGILLDDSHLGVDSDNCAALIAATESILAEAGAVLFVAASPVDWTERTRVFAGAGYQPTTLYMAKSGLKGDNPTSPARQAMREDVGGIVRLSALHRAKLQIASPIFWNSHAQADTRFAFWMNASLDLQDRSMFVTGPPETIDGYIIAQPNSPIHVPTPHDASATGLIDDFYAAVFEAEDKSAGTTNSPKGLISAAENAFCAKGINTALVICPARMTAKAGLLQGLGYKTANLWMVKGGA